MKRLVFIISVFIFLMSASLVLAGNDHQKTPKIVSLPEDKVIDRTYFAVGEMVEIYGTINSDAYIAGGEVLIDGTVNGDLLVIGGDVTIAGSVSQDVRVLGGNVTVYGDVGRNISAVGGNVYVSEGGDIGGDVVIAAGNARIATPVAGDITFVGGSILVAERVGGSMELRADLIRFNGKARVDGDLVYWSFQEALIDEGAELSGAVSYNEVASKKQKDVNLENFFAGVRIFKNVVGLVAALVIGLLLVTFMPAFSSRVNKTIFEQPLASFGAGMLAVVLIPLVSFILMVTVLGIKLGMILLLLFMVLICTAQIFSMLFIGQWISKLFTKEVSLQWAMIVGAFIFYILTLLPVLGTLLSLLALFFGLGGFLVAKKSLYRDLKTKKLI